MELLVMTLALVAVGVLALLFGADSGAGYDDLRLNW
jgi:hypothetical protein